MSIMILWIFILTQITFVSPHNPPPRNPERCPGCPYFLETPDSITTALGEQINLTCGVRHLGDKQVSWIRKKDLHVLTTDAFTYTTDARFRVQHKANSPYWVLMIEEPMVQDSGVYECQISTEPKMSRSFSLTVVVPQARIKGTGEMFMKAGSDINITCIISGASRPSHVTWFHITPSSPGKEKVEEVNAGGRGGVQLVTDKRSGYSWLLVTEATWRDAGNYTCAPAHATPATVSVHVLDEGAPAAMQRDLPSSGSSLHLPRSTPLLQELKRFSCSSLHALIGEPHVAGSCSTDLLQCSCKVLNCHHYRSGVHLLIALSASVILFTFNPL